MIVLPRDGKKNLMALSINWLPKFLLARPGDFCREPEFS
jgi:hypothetical protein